MDMTTDQFDPPIHRTSTLGANLESQTAFSACLLLYIDNLQRFHSLHIEVWTKWQPFRSRHFDMYIFQLFVFKFQFYPIDNKSALARIVALTEPMVTSSNNTYW